MTDKISRYNIEVEHNDKLLLYNSFTNALLPISYEDYSIIETLLENLPIFNRMYPELYSKFKASGFLISSEIDELALLRLKNKRAVFAHKDYHLTINPTLDCNLKCWYCSVSYAGAEHHCERMNDQVITALCKHVHNLSKKQKASSVLLDWFGGEPTMYFDEVIRKVATSGIEAASIENVDFRQHITTNATLLNEEKIRFMKETNFVFFQIPIDGNERKHNKIKSYKDGKGSYKDVVENIGHIVDIIPNAHITLRINYDKQTLKNIKDVVNDFSEHSKKRINVDFQKIWQITCTDKERGLLSEAMEVFKDAGFNCSFWAYKPLRSKCCYADSFNYYAVNFNGKIFKCTARDYSDDLMIGNLQSSGEIAWNDKILSRMYEKSGFENENCEICYMLPLCMGPCIQKNYERKIENLPFQCQYDNVEYSLSSYIIEMAKSMNYIN